MFSLVFIGLQPAMAMPPCRSNNVKAASEIIVEARVKALLIAESGLFGEDGIPTRMVKADLEIKRVIKGRFAGKEATVYGSPTAVRLDRSHLWF